MNEITISSMLPAVRNTALMRGKTYIGIDFGTSTTVVSLPMMSTTIKSIRSLSDCRKCFLTGLYTSQR